MEIREPIHNEPYCFECIYYLPLNQSENAQYVCNYILVNKKKRPCKFGKGCKVKRRKDGNL